MLSRLGSYSPQKPHPKQEAFLTLTCKEALYGGAAGGGKSSSLLLAALQFVHVPRYSALILRTDLQRLRLAGGLIPRSQEWLFEKANWNGSNFMWTWPNGATLQFGYLSNSQDKYRYGSSEYQYIGFDELTEFAEEDYLFLFSRLRMTEDIRSQGVFYRIRGASNPGGKGHEWVKNRFLTPEAEQDLKNNTLQSVYFKTSLGDRRAFVPAKVVDNPSVNREEYEGNLKHLPPIVRERLMNGDWTIMPTGLIRAEWLRYYSMQDQMVQLLESIVDSNGDRIHTNKVLHSFHINECIRFITVDTAGGSKDLTGESKGKRASWTVAGVWDYKRLFISNGQANHSTCLPVLMCKHVWRARVGFTEVAQQLKELYKQYKPSSIRVEDKTMGPDLVNMLQGQIPISTISTGGQDKVTRAAPLLNMLQQGQVYLPAYDNSWRQGLEAEWLSWQGIETDTNDQIDMSAYAAHVIGGFNNTGIVTMTFDPRERNNPQTKQRTGWL